MDPQRKGKFRGMWREKGELILELGCFPRGKARQGSPSPKTMRGTGDGEELEHTPMQEKFCLNNYIKISDIIIRRYEWGVRKMISLFALIDSALQSEELRF